MGTQSDVLVAPFSKVVDDGSLFMVTLSGTEITRPDGQIRLKTTISSPPCYTANIKAKIVSELIIK